MIEIRIPPLGLRQLSDEPFFCTGAQVAAVMRVVDDILGPLLWICSDVSATSSRGSPLAGGDVLIGSIVLGATVDAVTPVEDIDQFLSGVLAGVDHNVTTTDGIKIAATEEQPRFLNWPVETEIHMFDTTCIFLYFREGMHAHAFINALQKQNVKVDYAEVQ
ncbi:MAG: hypothetical protein KF757_10535 [Phycisphaeraceae bacterium]|nr:hypothetical protein [Phycisphaeraceae bacterium]MCW5764082.1 hypothetical protein [Phycisphaeraceae bacterium]